MVGIITGIVIGFTISIWYIALDRQYDFDTNIMVNIVIAGSAMIATSIHFYTTNKQRSDRIWEINKDILLQLALSLSKVIEEIEKARDYEFDCMQGIEHETGITYEYNKESHKNFSDSTFEVLNVYAPLMSNQLIEAIKHLKEVDEKTTESVNNGWLNNFEAYDSILNEHKQLQTMLNEFIKEISGIKYK